MKPYATGSGIKVTEVEQDEAAFQAAMQEFEMDKQAASNQGAHDARLRWWATRAEARGLCSFPLTPARINVAGALLKAGAYRSAAQYLAAMKRERISSGHPWTDSLTLAVKDAVRSCA